ncbi:hypothetical protein ABT173_28370 [Streptomyces sp. NPDC001795]|uniref:hypothetical protein n=1 Tax=Streptomyces sp. NPDC001795 TaxID=3154525 RepID=UPI00333269B9
MQPVHLPVQFFDAHHVSFVEQPPPTLSAWEQGEVDRIWQKTTARNPAAFDGPLVGSLGVDLPTSGQLVASWARMTYRHRALRQLRPPEHVPGAVFVTVLLPTESGLAIGRGSSTTATPGSAGPSQADQQNPHRPVMPLNWRGSANTRSANWPRNSASTCPKRN